MDIGPQVHLGVAAAPYICIGVDRQKDQVSALWNATGDGGILDA
jgi:hypothetical protein